MEYSENDERQLKGAYTLGAITTIIALAGILADVIIGTVTGGNLSALPQTAVDRFAEFRENKLLGLYHLDLLNIIIKLNKS